MSAFTDEDIQKLLASVNNPYERPERQKAIRRIVARLEAAENALNVAWDYACRNSGGISGPSVDIAVKAWRLAAGKDSR